MTATTLICYTITLAMIVSSLILGFVTAFWKTKAFLLGVRPDGIMLLYKAMACLCICVALFSASPFGLLSVVPGMILGGTVALLDVVQMDDDERRTFLRKNRGRYSDPPQITDKTTETYS